MLEYLQEYLGVYLATFIMWGFLMAFLYNMVKKSSSVGGGDKTVMWIALAMFLSYMVSDPLLNVTLGYNILNTTLAYLIWAASDLIMLSFIWFVTRKKNLNEVPAKLYIFTGLSVNILLFLAMYYDTNYAHFTGHWWFWDVYTVTVNTMDIMMIIALLCNKDFLGFVKLYRWGRGQAKLT